MKELGEALKAIFDKIGMFLDLFDLSFFISGATVVGAVAFGLYRTGNWPATLPPDWVVVVCVVLATYVAGMVCFALGRFLRKKRGGIANEDKRADLLEKLLIQHGLAGHEAVKGYLERAGTDSAQKREHTWALHNRLWAALRHDPALAPSLMVLNRYWVMAATYDGVAVALAVWGTVLGILNLPPAGLPIDARWVPAGGFFVGGVICAALCLREASRYTVHQIGELAATLAAAQKAK